MRFVKIMLLAAAVMLPHGSFARTLDYDSFFYSPKADEDMKVQTVDNSFTHRGIQYGVILNPLFVYEGADDWKSASMLLNTRLWAKMYLGLNTSVYARVKDSFLWPVLGSDLYSDLEMDNVFDLDLGYFNIKSDAGALQFSAGRKYFSIGTGLVLNDRGDGAELAVNYWFFSLNMLGMYTGLMLKDNNPYNLSSPDLTDGAKRIFAGGEAAFHFFNQKLYMFGLAQVDMSDQDPIDKSKYDSQYYGAGMNGVVFEGVAYYGEFIYEMGRGYSTGNTRTDIRAYAVNSGIDWYVPMALNPVLMLQYAFGSGDSNRNDYTSSTMQASDTRDNGFIYFGTYNGGYAFKPVLGNMHVIRAGASIAPFSESTEQLLNKMSLMAKYSCYLKDEKKSGVNAGDADQDNLLIGHGGDFSLRWQVYYDLSFYINYGLFVPGSAFDNKGLRQSAMSGFNLSF